MIMKSTDIELVMTTGERLLIQQNSDGSYCFPDDARRKFNFGASPNTQSNMQPMSTEPKENIDMNKMGQSAAGLLNGKCVDKKPIKLERNPEKIALLRDLKIRKIRAELSYRQSQREFLGIKIEIFQCTITMPFDAYRWAARLTHIREKIILAQSEFRRMEARLSALQSTNDGNQCVCTGKRSHIMRNLAEVGVRHKPIKEERLRDSRTQQKI